MSPSLKSNKQKNDKHTKIRQYKHKKQWTMILIFLTMCAIGVYESIDFSNEDIDVLIYLAGILFILFPGLIIPLSLLFIEFYRNRSESVSY